MKKTQLGILFFMSIIFTLVIVGNVSAMTVNSVHLEDLINEDNSIQESFIINISNNTDKVFTFTLPANAFDLKLNNNKFPIDTNVLNLPLNCQTCLFKIEYTIKDVVNFEGSDVYTFSRTLNFPVVPSVLDYDVKLPIGYVIKSNNSLEPSIVPSASGISTDGEHIIVKWLQKDPVLPSRYYVSYSNHESTENLASEFGNELTEWPVLVISLVLFLLGGIGGILIQKHYKNSKMKDYDIYSPSSLLSPDEKKVLELLKKNNNKMNQKNIVNDLSWSKSKVSAIMTNLEYKKVVKREKIGRNYTVEVITDLL
ncbi:hypothetical protein COV13_04155 [Candidatus Woesearchaeota archaeon CG10_big_fil_rev_8_21_14_0_10_32_9]|nr:MAG: hypothetical protein COV13_04155 [Candidatus Woesearchaeota archaeon CG10_big_fil_rev_8_21_14_0_10_32_9]